MGKGSEIDRAAKEIGDTKAKQPGQIRRPAAGPKGMESEVGNERKDDMQGAMYGNPNDKAVIHSGSLKGAVSELKSQHPYKHSDRGPHHGGKAHIRHEPMHGMHPKSRHGR